jgi:glucosamine-phosphate N-acetyltransferase
MIIRRLEPNDYYLGYLELLSSLTIVGDITYDMWMSRFLEIQKYPNIHNWIIIDTSISSNIIAIGTIIIEHKFIHNCGSVGHIEDIVVSSNHQGLGLGKKIIDHLCEQGKLLGCYKVILNCKESNVGFYKRCGFNTKDIQMANYFNLS